MPDYPELLADDPLGRLGSASLMTITGVIWLWVLGPALIAFKVSVGLGLGLGIFGLKTIIQGLCNTLPGVRNQQPVETRIQSM